MQHLFLKWIKISVIPFHPPFLFHLALGYQGISPQIGCKICICYQEIHKIDKIWQYFSYEVSVIFFLLINSSPETIPAALEASGQRSESISDNRVSVNRPNWWLSIFSFPCLLNLYDELLTFCHLSLVFFVCKSWVLKLPSYRRDKLKLQWSLFKILGDQNISFCFYFFSKPTTQQ